MDIIILFYHSNVPVELILLIIGYSNYQPFCNFYVYIHFLISVPIDSHVLYSEMDMDQEEQMERDFVNIHSKGLYVA